MRYQLLELAPPDHGFGFYDREKDRIVELHGSTVWHSADSFARAADWDLMFQDKMECLALLPSYYGTAGDPNA